MLKRFIIPAILFVIINFILLTLLPNIIQNHFWLSICLAASIFIITDTSITFSVKILRSRKNN